MENAGNNGKHNISALIFSAALLIVVTIASLVSAPYIEKKVRRAANDGKMEQAGQRKKKLAREADSLYSAGAIDKAEYGRANVYRTKATLTQITYFDLHANGKNDSTVKRAKACLDSMESVLYNAQRQKQQNSSANNPNIQKPKIQQRR